MESHSIWKRQGMTLSALNFWNRAMASKRTTGPVAALVAIGSIQIAVVILDATYSTPGTGQWLIILIFRRHGGIAHVWTGKVRLAGMKLGPMRFEPARRFGVQP
jgi:hypothetical protein